MSILPGRIAVQFMLFERYIFIFVLILMITGIISYLISPPIIFFTDAIFTLFGLPFLGL
jgi:hypothetical protein